MAGRLLTTEQLAEWLGVSVGTVNRFRLRGDGPKYVKIGKTVRYRESDVEAYLAGRVTRSTSDKLDAAAE
jgi:excisionase family DNA binding protein